ncbi:MAG: FAD-dependent monooxygenase [Pseudomonadota bacterium]
MSVERYDLVIAGGGLAGLTAAAAFGAADFSVLVVDPAPPPDPEAANADRRSTAFLQPAKALFDAAGLWPALEPHATALTGLRIIDAGGDPPAPRVSRVFSPVDLGQDSFGWNLPNALARCRLAAALAEMEGVTHAWGQRVTGLVTRTGEARLRLDRAGGAVAARLVIAADGRASVLRSLAGIDARTWHYRQRAFAFQACHAIPHQGISTEIYLDGGAFTTVPMPDLDGRPCSAIVWMNNARRAEALAALDARGFNEAMSARACYALGAMERASPMADWPIITRTAARLTAERVALVAEAAHVMPPIGAQGLNTSLHDIAVLYDLAQAAPADLGTPAFLARYARAREGDIALRARVIDAYNRLCQSGAAPLQGIRRAGLRLVHDVAPLRRAVMQAGLGRR